MNPTKIILTVSPWLAPLPTAYVVMVACVDGLGWPWAIAIIAALIIETIGLATSSKALELYAYNKSKRESDPEAPAKIAWAMTGAVILAQSILIIALDKRLELLLFQVFSLAAVMVLALDADHIARLQSIAEAKAKEAAKRAENSAAKKAIAQTVQEPAPVVQPVAIPAQAVAEIAQETGYTAFAIAQRSRNGEGMMQPEMIMDKYGVSRRTAYGWIAKYREANLQNAHTAEVVVK
jgi:hypothetical protein